MSLRLFLALLILGLCLPLSAQKTKTRVKNRAERRANSRVDQKVDQAVDEAFNAVGNLFKKKNKQPKTSPSSDTAATRDRAQGDPRYNQRVEDGGLRANDEESGEYADEEEARQALSNLFGGGSKFEAYENERSFSVVLEIEEVKRNGKTESSKMHIGALPTQSAYRMLEGGGKQQESAQMIFDTQTGKTTVISEENGQRKGTRMRMPNFAGMAQRELDAQENTVQVTKTGETRTINGYRCTKYTYVDTANGYSGESWITQDVDLTHADVFGVMTASFGGGGMQLPAEMNRALDGGFPIQTTSTDKKGTTSTMTMSSIKIGAANVDRSLFDTSGVTIEELGGF